MAFSPLRYVGLVAIATAIVSFTPTEADADRKGGRKFVRFYCEVLAERLEDKIDFVEERIEDLEERIEDRDRKRRFRFFFVSERFEDLERSARGFRQGERRSRSRVYKRLRFWRARLHRLVWQARYLEARFGRFCDDDDDDDDQSPHDI